MGLIVGHPIEDETDGWTGMDTLERMRLMVGHPREDETDGWLC